jgi:heme exporter protein B
VVMAAVAILARELRLAIRQGFDSLLAVVFFVLASILFPFGVGPEPAVLARIAPGIIWVAALLAALLSLDRLFQTDFDDGSLELLALSPLPLTAVVLIKILAHWLITAGPLLIAAPLLAILFGLSGEALAPLLGALALGTPGLSVIGAIGAALVLGARRSGVLLALLILPLYIPILILGVAAVDAAVFGLAIRPHLTLLAGLSLGALVLGPPTVAAAVRLALK